MKSQREQSSVAKVYVSSGFNNTIITLTSNEGNVLGWTSSGVAGFKGARKSTPFAASTAALSVAKKAVELGIGSVSVFVKGPGVGRDAAIRSLKAGGLDVTSIADVTPIPHNGCRPKKRRRV
jgi:small subunit ribosomal protein S11